MRKYNLHNIMKRAWELVKGFGFGISEALKKAWKEAKEMAKTLRDELIEKLEAIVEEKNSHDNGYHYELSVNDWKNYGKSRTYLSIIETRDNSKHYVKSDYGYVDNKSNEYVPHKYNRIK